MLPHTRHQVQYGGAGNPGRQHQAQADHRRPVAQCGKGQQRACDTDTNGPTQATSQIDDIGLAPPRHWSHAHQEQGRRHQRYEHGIEIRWADRQLAHAQGVDHQRVHGAQQHCGCSHDQQHIVGQQHGLAGYRLEAAAQPDPGCPPGEQRQRATDHDAEEGQDENPARRVGGKRVYRTQHAGAHDERSQQGQGKREYRQQRRPHLEAASFFSNGQRMDERGSNQPGHEGSVFHRVPEPPATPAQLVVGPEAAQRNADGQETPGYRGPGPRPTGPGSVQAARQQGRDGKCKCHHEAHIAHVQHRRMNNHARVLQQRVEVPAVGRHREHPLERVGREKREQDEATAHQPHHAEHPCHHRFVKLFREYRHRQRPQRQDQRPQQDGAFMVAPHRRDAVHQR